MKFTSTIAGILIGVALTLIAQWLVPTLRMTHVVDCPEPTIIRSVDYIDTCLTIERITFDSSVIKDVTPDIQIGEKPKFSRDSIVAVVDSTMVVDNDTVVGTKLKTHRIDYFEYDKGNLRIKETVVHTGEILSFNRYVELDTPYIKETIQNEVVITPNITQTEKFFEVERRYPKILVGAYGQFEDFMGYNAGLGVGYQFKNGASLTFDYMLTDLSRPLLRANLYYPIITLKDNADAVIKPFDPGKFYD